MGAKYPSHDAPPTLGIEGESLRYDDGNISYRVDRNGYYILWENSNYPDRGLFYGCVYKKSRVSGREDCFLPDVLTLKCWVFAKMEEYDAKAPHTFAGVSE